MKPSVFIRDIRGSKIVREWFRKLLKTSAFILCIHKRVRVRLFTEPDVNGSAGLVFNFHRNVNELSDQLQMRFTVTG